MKMKRVKELAALAMCGLMVAGTATAQVTVESSTSGSSTVYTIGTWNELSGLGVDNGSYVVNRFGVENGRLVAYGRLVPTTGSSSMSMRSDGTIISSVDHASLGSWTGIGTGYGESGRESRSNLPSSSVGTSSMTLVRSSADDDIDLSVGATSGNDRVADPRGIDLRFGPTSGNDRVGSAIDLRFGPTSGNDRVGGVDLSMGATSGNDRVGANLDPDMGATSGNDRVGADVDLKFGPTSGNDRVADPSAVDLHFGPTSGNDRTADGIDLKVGPTSGNDRVGANLDMNVGATSGNDRAAFSVASSDVAIPVSVVSASCDAVTLSFGNGEFVTVTPMSGSSYESTRSSLCAVAGSSDNTTISSHLNGVILGIE